MFCLPVLLCCAADDCACGDVPASGVERSKTLDSLSATEAATLCGFVEETMADERWRSCAEMFLDVGDREECIERLGTDSPECSEVTVYELEDCLAQACGIVMDCPEQIPCVAIRVVKPDGGAGN